MHGGKKIIIGIGGTIGSGKTMVSMIFKELGAHYISADKVGWQVLPEIADKIKKRFGDAVMSGDAVDKKKLRTFVFSSRRNLDYLNTLSHPHLIKRIIEMTKNAEAEIVVIDAALLFNWPEIYQFVDYPILVVSNDRLKEERVLRKGIDKKLFRMILQCQKSETEMSKQARYIIRNNGTADELKEQCLNIYKEIKDGY